MLTTLRTNEEVRSLRKSARPDLPKPDPRMLEIAEKIVEQQTGEFDPRVRRPLRAGAARPDRTQEEGAGRPAATPQVDDTKVIDLMAALKKSLESQKRPASTRARTTTNRKKAGSRRAA